VPSGAATTIAPKANELSTSWIFFRSADPVRWGPTGHPVPRSDFGFQLSADLKYFAHVADRITGRWGAGGHLLVGRPFQNDVEVPASFMSGCMKEVQQ